MSSVGDVLEEKEEPAPKTPSPVPPAPESVADDTGSVAGSTASTGKRKRAKKPKGGGAEGVQVGRKSTIDPEKVTDFQVII